MDYYDMKQDLYEAHAADIDTMVIPLHVLDGSESFLTIRQQSLKLLEFCQEIEQPLTGRVILMPELWVAKDQWETSARQWGRWWLKPPFRVLLFVKLGPSTQEESGARPVPLRRLSEDAEIYLADLDRDTSPEDTYRELLTVWSTLHRTPSHNG